MSATGPKVAFPAPDLPLEVVQLVFSATDSEGEDVLSLGDRVGGGQGAARAMCLVRQQRGRNNCCLLPLPPTPHPRRIPPACRR